ncbi:unnamed protein product [Triticum aestivum]|uniref:AP2/ERF domain-containing protein n=7 Tax=Triticinae TaxID=1648030 RepID=A0A9R1JH27_WHEAT|nr:AP2-like ethylene-responsive transcription factor BBM2 [Aegilops tauschii subsp. strangulata]XP_044333344.1 AP2-like ethylene-responsive transcription factor BBM2 [Triticum aestivum]KAF7017231.1 hypothetical protein CFC21_030700 [Triticum aestivum]SPT18986.1 unnamed protein product [Triticum aestivum]
MASANNWLGFSLSGQGNHPQPHQNGSPAAAAIDGDFYGLQGQTAPDAHLGMSGLRADANYGVMDAFNGGTQETQDWAMRGLDYHGGSSELSMLVGSSGGRMTVDDGEAPKLEDFLGGNSFSDVQDHAGSYLFSSGSAMGSGAASGSHGVDGRGGSTIELSMIKTWLRNDNNQAQHDQEMSADASATSYACSGAPGSTGNGVGVASSRGQGLALSMSMGSNSHPQMPVVPAAVGTESTSSENKRVDSPSAGTADAVQRKSIDTFGQRTSIYRGVTRHRWTGRYEAHLWDNSCRREGQTRKGKQVYLGGYDKEDKAARAYDLAALKYWGTTTTTNIPISTYEKEIEEMKHMTRQEYIAYLRRNSSGFSRGASKYRGVTRHHQQGRWQARIGRVAGNKDLYLGTFTTEEEAAEAYDIAAIKFRGLNAVTNFEMSRYDVKSILEGSTLPVGGAARRLKEAAELAEAGVWRAEDGSIVSHLQADAMAGYHHGWPTSIAFGSHQQQQSAAQLALHYPYGVGGQARGWCKPEQDAVIAAGHGGQDMQELHLGSGGSTHNFFQPASRTAVYGNGGGGAWYQGLGGNAYMMPVGTVVDADQGHSGSTATTEEGRLVGYGAEAGVDPYAAMRRAYELSQGSSSVSVAKVADGYSNNWSSPFNGMG